MIVHTFYKPTRRLGYCVQSTYYNRSDCLTEQLLRKQSYSSFMNIDFYFPIYLLRSYLALQQPRKVFSAPSSEYQCYDYRLNKPMSVRGWNDFKMLTVQVELTCLKNSVVDGVSSSKNRRDNLLFLILGQSPYALGRRKQAHPDFLCGFQYIYQQ